MCRVSPGCYTVEVKALPGRLGGTGNGGDGSSSMLGGETKKRLIMIDPARGHMDKPVVVVPIELSSPV